MYGSGGQGSGGGVGAVAGCWNSGFRGQTWGEDWVWMRRFTLPVPMGHPSRILVHGWSGCYGLCNVGTQGWGQGLGWFHSSRGGSWCLTLVDLCWWLYESIWGTSRLTACIPMAKVGPTAEPATVTHLLPMQWVTTPQRHHRVQFLVDRSCGVILSHSSPNRSTPVWPT